MIPNFPLNVFRDRKVEIPTGNVPPHKTVQELVDGERKVAADGVVHGRQHHFAELGIKIAGFGGQGVLLLGQVLAEMGMREGLEVSWLPSYGPEMRSGSAHCHVCLSKERIGSPVLSRPKVLIAMNESSLRKSPPAAPSSTPASNSLKTSASRRRRLSAFRPPRSPTNSAPRKSRTSS